MKHKTYELIVKSIKAGILVETFTIQDWRKACPGLPDGTYNTFLHKHAMGNPRGNSELFIRVGPGQFKCVRPFKYGF